jgi:hypothetical protein
MGLLAHWHVRRTYARHNKVPLPVEFDASRRESADHMKELIATGDALRVVHAPCRTARRAHHGGYRELDRERDAAAPPPNFGATLLPDSTHVAFNFNAQSNPDYLVQSRTSLDAGNWAKLQDLSSAPTNRSLWVANLISGASAKYFFLTVGP